MILKQKSHLDIIFKQTAAKKAKISEEMSLVADKYSQNDPVPC
jgi:hypothetical protein